MSLAYYPQRFKLLRSASVQGKAEKSEEK